MQQNGSVNTTRTGVAAKPDPPSPAAIFAGVTAYLVVLAVIILVSIRWGRRRRQRADAAILQALTQSGARPLSTGPDGGYQGTPREYELLGQRFLVQSYAISRYYYRFNLSVATPPLPAITILPEGKVDRFGKLIGLNREIQIGEQAFDDAAYVDTAEADTPVQQLFASPAVRDGVRELLALGYKVQLSARGVEAFQILAQGKPAELSHVGEAVALLGKVAAALPRLDPASFGGEHPTRWPRLSGLFLLWLVPLILFGMLDGFLQSPGERTLDGGHKPLLVGLGALTAWILYVLFLALWLRGRPYALRALLLAAFAGLFGLPISGVSVTLALNQCLDKSAAEEHVVSVMRKSRYKGDCRVSVSSWRAADDSVQLPVACERFDQLPKGTELRVRSHAGALGLNWVEPLK